MQQFLAEIGDWLAAIMHHWEVVVATGAIPFAIDIVDKLVDWKMPKRYYAIFLGVGLLLAMFLSWDEEHRNFSASDRARNTADTNYRQCDSERATLRTLNESLSSQLSGDTQFIDNQQGTLNSCVVALAKNAVTEPLHVSVWMIGVGIVKTPTLTEMALITNRQTVIRGNLECDEPFNVFDWNLPSGGARMNVSTNQISPNKWFLQTLSPPWETQVPVMVTAVSNSTLHGCRFTPQQQ